MDWLIKMMDNITLLRMPLSIETLDLVGKMNASLNNFEDLLEMAKKMYCKGAQLDPNHEDLKEWPNNWRDAQKLLSERGYKDAKEYYICLNATHPCHWDILENKNDLCRHWRTCNYCLLLYGT
jgi:hypothetical protein